MNILNSQWKRIDGYCQYWGSFKTKYAEPQNWLQRALGMPVKINSMEELVLKRICFDSQIYFRIPGVQFCEEDVSPSVIPEIPCQKEYV